MSIIFGIKRPVGDVIEERHLWTLANATDRWAPDGTFVRVQGGIGMGFQPYRTQQRSILESQPVTDDLGNMVTLDGRLDNHQELRDLLTIDDPNTLDSLIVLAAFRRWGDDCFTRLIGDWALAIWSQPERALYLARDHAGTRTLYVRQTEDQVLWSTYLETFLAERISSNPDRNFVLRYMACLPLHDLTPYEHIRSIPPSQYLRISEGSVVQQEYWTPFRHSQTVYRKDQEYEEHFFCLFKQAVERRTGPGAPIIAELSGGIDSTSIVCMSDYIRTNEAINSRQDYIDTVSYYRDTEKTWDERPYFEATEKCRGKQGIHLEISEPRFDFRPTSNSSIVPGIDSTTLLREKTFESTVGPGGYRSILSGLGGDELLGGVPTPLPELADELMGCQFVRLFRDSIRWSLANRNTLINTVTDVGRFAVSLYHRPSSSTSDVPPWFTEEASKRHGLKYDNSDRAIPHMFKQRPSAISNALAWWSTLETLPHLFPRSLARYEFRYPYLDRDLAEFVLSIPRSQILQPGKRRYLMKRSLKAVIPEHILNRRRKGFIAGGMIRALQSQAADIRAYFRESVLAEQGLIDLSRFLESLEQSTALARTDWCRPIRATVAMEQWLRTGPTGGHRPPCDRDCKLVPSGGFEESADQSHKV